MPRVVLLDNYDSFTYNLEQALRMLGAEVQVHRNDEVTVEQVKAMEPTHLVEFEELDVLMTPYGSKEKVFVQYQ